MACSANSRESIFVVAARVARERSAAKALAGGHRQWKVALCHNWQHGLCLLGDACDDRHGVEDFYPISAIPAAGSCPQAGLPGKTAVGQKRVFPLWGQDAIEPPVKGVRSGACDWAVSDGQQAGETAAKCIFDDSHDTSDEGLTTISANIEAPSPWLPGGHSDKQPAPGTHLPVGAGVAASPTVDLVADVPWSDAPLEVANTGLRPSFACAAASTAGAAATIVDKGIKLVPARRTAVAPRVVAVRALAPRKEGLASSVVAPDLDTGGKRRGVCPKGHSLKRYMVPDYGIGRSGTCDGCMRKVVTEEVVMDCRICNWYLCDKCFPLETEEEMFDAIWRRYAEGKDRIGQDAIFRHARETNPVDAPPPSWYTAAQYAEICADLRTTPAAGISRKALFAWYRRPGGGNISKDFKTLFRSKRLSV